nr:DUF4129 domain-containing protein [Natronolimnobius sp. AArcel1]
MFVVGCIVCLLVVASTMPAADPRIDPAGDDETSIAGEWDALDATGINLSEGETDNETDASDDSDTTETDDIEVDGQIEPGNEVMISIDTDGPFNERDIAVNNESIGTTDWGEITTTVPYAEEMTVTVPEDDTSQTFSVETDATISTVNGPAPNSTLDVSVDAGSTSVPNATVFVDGEAAGMTDEDGQTAVQLPETAGPTDIRAERATVSGERTIDVPEPDVSFASPFLFPGSPAPVSVTADGEPVEGATVSLADGGSDTTGADGQARVWLPIDDTATVTATAGAESATATVDDLYLRLAALAILGSGFVIGLFVTYVRIIARRDRDGDTLPPNSGVPDLFVGLADLFGGASSAIKQSGSLVSSAADNLFGLGSRVRRLRLPSLSVLRGRQPGQASRAGGFSFGLPSIGPALVSVGSIFGAFPSLGSLFANSSRREDDGAESSLRSLFGRQTDDSETADGAPVGPEQPALADEPLGPQDPRRDIRATWHVFLDRVGISNRETLTPGQAARYALSVGYPAEQVSRLVRIVRDVEYGSRTASGERVRTARTTTNDLLEYDHEDDETEGDE